MTRQLVTIRRIDRIDPIPNSDNIDVATIDGWKVVVKKGEHQPGEKVLFFEIDSFLPVRPEYEFLRPSSFRTHLITGEKGFVLRTVRLRGQISQGLVMPLAPEFSCLATGTDMTDRLGVTKWETPIPTELAGDIAGAFPAFVPKTDEERIQNLASSYDDLRGLPGLWTIREKLDGTSTTFFRLNGEFGVCSRNWKMTETPSHTAWQIARSVGLPENMALDNYALQGELIGPGIQGNPYKIAAVQFRPFSLFHIGEHRYCSDDDMSCFSCRAGFEPVPMVGCRKLPSTVAELIELADGRSSVDSKMVLRNREGIVCRYYEKDEVGCEFMRASFKVISNAYLLKGAQQ